MNILLFQRETILKGFVAFLALGVGVQLHAQGEPSYCDHDMYLASLSANSTGNTPCVTPDIAVEPVAEGLILHRFNNSAAATAGSSLLGAGSFFVDGYIDQGGTYSSSEDYLTPAAMNDQDGYQMNQLYLSFGRKVVKGNDFSFGGRIDVMFGTDYYYMSSAGLENRCDNSNHWNGMGDDWTYRGGRGEYGFALPQAYAEIYAPIMNGVDMKVGHFYSVMGYESLQNDRNFFYSRSYSRLYGMPTSMTGAVSEVGLGYGWDMVFGLVNEWNAFDALDDSFSGVFGLNYKSRNGFFTFAATTMIGEQHAPCYQFETYSEDAEMCYVFNTYAKFQFTERFSYVCEFTAGYDDREYFCEETFDFNRGRAWFGLSSYAFFKVVDQLTLGVRFEWFHDADNTVIDSEYGVASIDDAANYYALTFGANWTPVSWLSVRPEIRYDFSDFECDGWQTYDNWGSDYQLTFGADVVVRF